MPRCTVLCLLAPAALLAASGQSPAAPESNSHPPPAVADKKDFVNPNPGGLFQPPNVHSKLWNNDLTKVDPNVLTPGSPGIVVSVVNQCSIPLKWAKAPKSAPDPRGRKWIGPHPERVDPIYGPTPAPVCTDTEDKPPVKSDKPSK